MTNMKATAFAAGVDGEGETQDDASEEEIQTGVDDGAGSGLSSEGEGELSGGESECEVVRVSRDCVRTSRNNKSSVYNHLVSSLTVAVPILIPVFLFCAVLGMVICCSYKFWKLFVSAFISRICVSRKIVLLP